MTVEEKRLDMKAEVDLREIAKVYKGYYNDEFNANYALYLIRKKLGITDSKMLSLLKDILEVKE